MRPEFGCQIHDLIFAPNDATTAGLAAYYVEEALGMWEPRIRVQEVTAGPDPNDPVRLLVEVRPAVSSPDDQLLPIFSVHSLTWSLKLLSWLLICARRDHRNSPAAAAPAAAAAAAIGRSRAMSITPQSLY